METLRLPPANTLLLWVPPSPVIRSLPIWYIKNQQPPSLMLPKDLNKHSKVLKYANTYAKLKLYYTTILLLTTVKLKMMAMIVLPSFK